MSYLIKELLIPFIKEFYLHNKEFKDNIKRPKTVAIIVFVISSVVVTTHLSISYLKDRDLSLGVRYNDIYEQYVDLQQRHLDTLKESGELQIEVGLLTHQLERLRNTLERCQRLKDNVEEKRMQCEAALESIDDVNMDTGTTEENNDAVLEILREYQ